jgi:hypothetical protein
VILSELTVTWTVKVLLSGDNVSSRLTGTVRVRAEEDAARLAEFTLLPSAGVVDPIDWTGAAVVIDFARIFTGATVYTRIFTGVVDVADYDPITRIVKFACTDDLQHVVAGLTTPAIDAIVGGDYSVGAQGRIDEHWAYAQARLESVAGSLDCSAARAPRMTLWDGLPTWRTFDSGDILDGSLGVELPRRKSIVNRIDIVYQYRFHRLRERWTSLGFSASIIGTDAYARGYNLPSQQAVESALSGAGWHVISAAYDRGHDYVKIGVPAGAPAGANADWWMVTGGGIRTVKARVAQRHAQPITEEYAIVVEAPDSISAHGIVAKPLRGALESTWNPSEWEQDMAQAPDASAGNVDHAPDAPRTDSDAAITALINMARKLILSSHRTARAFFSVPCLPEVDLDRAAAVDTDTMDATGKIAEFEHVLDLGAGSAITRIGLALSGVAAGGLTVDDAVTVPSPPDADAEAGSDPWEAALPILTTHVGSLLTSAYSEDLMGWLSNAPERLNAYNFTLDTTYSFDNPYYAPGTLGGAVRLTRDFPVTGFRCRLPGVADGHRQAMTLPIEASHTVAIPEDPFTLNA